MSTLDTSCYTFQSEKETGAGEMNPSKSPPSSSASSHLIVSEVLNEIIDNAFEVAMARTLQSAPKVEKITSNVVGDILENILSPTADTAVSNESYRDDETALLDEEIKRIIQEMKYPEEKFISTKGTGDQLGAKSEVTPDKILAEPIKRNTLERKNRLTNLVRSSKQMFTRLVSSDTENELRATKSEETHEKILRVIDLQGDEHYMEAGCSSATGILRMPIDSSLDTIDLKNNAQSEGGHIEKDTSCIVSKVDSKKSSNSNKKKLTLGSRIMRYFKRNKDSKRE